MRHRPTRLLVVEALEDRWVPAGPAIDLFTVALHEFGHSIGLPHAPDSECSGSGVTPAVMCPFYNGPVTDLDAYDVQQIQNLYPEGLGNAEAAGRWDVKNGDGSPRMVTYSWVPDGTQMDRGGKSATFSTFNAIYGSPSVWQPIFTSALAKWTAAVDADNGNPGLDTRLLFASIVGTPTGSGVDTGLKHNSCSYASQGDLNAGDIRIAAHGFDGPGNVLAHAYFPPPNSCSQAGDAHFDKAENWVGTGPSNFTAGSGSSPGNSDRGREYITLAPAVPAAVIVVQPNQVATDTTSDVSASASQASIKTDIGDQSSDALSESNSFQTDEQSVPNDPVRTVDLDDLSSGREDSADEFGLYDLVAGDIADVLF